MDDVSVSYGIVSALRNVTLTIFEGEFVALIGANGAGKSTFVETVLGIQRPKSGTVSFMGQDITQKPTEQIVASGISLCPEGRGILWEMTVLENLLLGAYHNRRKIDQSMSRVFEIFPILQERLNQTAGTLSGGQQQMLSIARALMARTRLLMLDEPSLGLAPLVVNEVLEIIKKLSEEGYTIVLSEQNAKKALQYASRAYVFETGRIVLEGHSRQLMNNEAVIQAYLGG
jgi:branched-chain amino acid transport system ATP-binding protein